MAPASTSDVPNNDPQLGFINRDLQNLRKKYNLILQREKTLAKKRRKLRSSKSSAVAHIDFYEKLSKVLSSGQLSLVSTSGSGAKRGRGVAAGQLHTQESRGPVEMSPAPDTPVQENESVGLNKAEPRPSMNESETKEPRYLLVSNGCAICCLDLKQSKGDSVIKARDIPLLPKIATLKLLEEGLPVLVGLFKLGSDVYMIGGQELPPLSKVPNRTAFCIQEWGKNPKGYNLYRTLCEEYKAKGTSRVTYRLSLAGNDGTLSHSECSNIGKSKKPKFWPIVEKIKGQIHVIDSVPVYFVDPLRDWIFSHETLNNCEGRRHHRWTEIPTLSEMVYISSHLVVGDRIYGVSYGKFVVFDSNMNKWEATCEGVNWLGHALTAEKVWHILKCRGIARCVGEYPLRVRGEAAIDPLYVLVAVVGSSAFAYLVTSTGRVVCVQKLHDFYVEPVEPWFMEEGTMIDVDEEGKTVCAIVNASAMLNGRKVDSSKDYLFINTFSVEMLTEASSKVLEILAKGKYVWPVEQEFVRVDIKHRHIFKTDADLNGEGDLPGFLPGVQACFM